MIRLAAVLALTATAAGACPMSLAIYTEPTSGFELGLRVPAPWEQVGMIDYALRLGLPDGRALWGEITQNMGVSRSEGRLYSGCPSHAQDAHLDDEILAGCLAWEGVIYALDGGRIAPLPFADEPAPPSLVLADFGRQLRYAIMDGPDPEIWDQLDLTGCTE